MAYAFDLADLDTAAAVRRIAAEELTAALSDMDDPAIAEAKLVHGLRKHVKMIRGLIRLVRPNFPGYDLENAALRDAARGISGLRDAEVLRATLERIAAKAPPEAAGALDHLRTALESHQTDTRDSGAAEALAAFRGAVQDSLLRVPDWKLRGKALNLLEDGLATTWEKAKKRQRQALRAPGTETIHDWRKRVKDHWYQSRLLTPIWPKMMEPHAATADKIGEWLGEHHDIAVFVDRLDSEALSTSDHETLTALARNRQKKLEKKSHAAATRLFAGTDRALLDRWGTWWQVWQAGR